MPEGLEDGYNSRHFVEIVCVVIIQPAGIAIAIVAVITLISSAVPAYIRLLMLIAVNSPLVYGICLRPVLEYKLLNRGLNSCSASSVMARSERSGWSCRTRCSGLM